MISIIFSDNIKNKYKSFEEILKLDNYNDIIYIWCCGDNNLYNLPKLPNSLIKLYCYNNSLSSLPELPKSLKLLHCSNNNLSNLPELPNSLEYLDCEYNSLSSLPQIPKTLKLLLYRDNPIYIYIKKYFNVDTDKYFEYEKNMKRKFINKIENWYLDCKYNPKFLYCRKRLMKEYNELYN